MDGRDGLTTPSLRDKKLRYNSWEPILQVGEWSPWWEFQGFQGTLDSVQKSGKQPPGMYRTRRK